MYPVSQEYQTAINSNHRKTHGRIIIDFSPAIQLTFLDDEIFLIHFIEEKGPVANALPYGHLAARKLDIKLYDKDHIFNPQNQNSPIYGLVKPNCKIQAAIGIELPDKTIEWIPLGTFWSENWDIPEDQPWVSTIGRDRLYLLQRSLYQTGSVVATPAVVVHVDDNQEDWSQDILCNVTPTSDGDLILNISGVN